ncbi:MAG TPA: 4'-phosphopantetheinyl transferase superfamily protein [Arenimonas sp.]|uniref:4'-phosphopantetheinyl transferase family protein n=1 Tax=Arenimonas sp. TaxID=1872635 RepID=UPI002D7FBA9E|nr:4'-phosphopantetheinyl transferase superfamily protein [Arenimonas sp.]HEU0153706.1 4'-phosphopantetheinyl transferase superfamily protein [Arenimonas sp.]
MADTADCRLALASLPDVEARLPGPGTAWLTAAEDLRLQAISAALRRRQYLAGHWLLRMMASESHGGAATDWRFASDEDPRPRLRHDDGRLLWASLSHSGEHLAAAIAPAPVGIDLERPRKPRDYVAIARFLFSPEEADQVEAAEQGSGRERVFHRYWALKEARGKRSGEGLQPSQARRVSARPADRARAEAWHWTFADGACVALAAWPGVSPTLGAGVAPDGAWQYADAD